MNYAEAIKKLRNKMLMTQIEFAKYLEVSFQSVNRWETGKFDPTMKIKRKLAPLFEKYEIEVESSMAHSLELTWYGKENEVKLEPRLLIDAKKLRNTVGDDSVKNILNSGE